MSNPEEDPDEVVYECHFAHHKGQSGVACSSITSSNPAIALHGVVLDYRLREQSETSPQGGQSWLSIRYAVRR